MAHEHSIIDADAHFVIDKGSRKINSTDVVVPMIMQYDHNSERISFSIPADIEGHDMLLCNRVIIDFLNVDSKDNTKTNAGRYEVTDLATSEEDSDRLVFSWLISSAATFYEGTTAFLIAFEEVDNNGDIIYRWATEFATLFKIGKGYTAAPGIMIDHIDVLEKWYADVLARVEGVTQEQATATLKSANEYTDKKVEDIEVTGGMTTGVLATPDDAIETATPGFYVYGDWLENFTEYADTKHVALLSMSSSYYKAQIIAACGYDKTQIMVRSIDLESGNVPGAWMVLNPAYLPGIVYRTAEFIGGKPVYSEYQEVVLDKGTGIFTLNGAEEGKVTRLVGVSGVDDLGVIVPSNNHEVKLWNNTQVRFYAENENTTKAYLTIKYLKL